MSIKIYFDENKAKEINNMLNLSRNYRKQKKILKSYSLMKKLYREYGIKEIIPEMVNVAISSNKQNLLRNKTLKFNLINNLINFGIKENQNENTKIRLIAWKLYLCRNFNRYQEYEYLFQKIDNSTKNDPYVLFENLHYLLEKEDFSLAEDELAKLFENKHLVDSDKSFLGIRNFIIDMNECLKLAQVDIKFNDIIYTEKKEEKKSSDFSYIVVVTGNYLIFKYEILKFITSLNEKSSDFLLFILIHNASEKEKQNICLSLKNLGISNYKINFENIDKSNFNEIETRTFYSFRRFILAKELLDKYKLPIFSTDADTVVLKNLKFFIRDNDNVDMSLTIKTNNRTFKNTISAGYALFLPTEASYLFLDFCNRLLFHITKHRRLIWFSDQIVLYSAYIFTKRKLKTKINSNIDNDHNNPDSYFYHTLHNRYSMDQKKT